MLLYSLLHLTGYPLTIDELRAFRQLGSRTAGHPEREPHLGIETTTGPLGQGIANAVGMALAEKLLAAQFNRPGHEVVDHRTWVFLGDGCLMEGISHEAVLAGRHAEARQARRVLRRQRHLHRRRGEAAGAPTTRRRASSPTAGNVIRARRWPRCRRHRRGHRQGAAGSSERPTLICCKTVIGWGAPNKAGSKSTHGEALGAEEVAAAREKLGWTSPPFEIPAPIRAAWDQRARGTAAAAGSGRSGLRAYEQAHPDLAREFDAPPVRRAAGRLGRDRASRASKPRWP